MHEHRLLEITVVELLGAVRHDNDRKFQSLGLVDGQNADRTAGCLGTDRLEILALFEHAAQQAHKVKQAAEALSLKRARPLEERQQVALALCAVRQSAVQTERTGLIVNLPQQAVHRLIARKSAQKVQPLQKGFHLREIRSRLQKRVIIADLAIHKANIRQFLLGESEQRRTHHTDKVNILPRVVNDAEQRHHRADLGGLEQAAALFGAGCYADALQLRNVGRRLVFRRAQQDYDVARRDRTQPSGLLIRHRKAFIEQRTNALCGKPRFEFGLVRRIIVLAESVRIHEQDFGLIPLVSGLRIVVRTEVQRLLVRVHEIAHGLAHDGGKQVVARVQHSRSRTEILPEDNTARLSAGGVRRLTEAAVFLKENGRVRQSKAVNALLDVTDHEQVGLVSGECAEDGILHGIGVLILVYRNFGELLGHGFRQCGRLAGCIQQTHGKVLQIVEIRSISRTFRCRKSIVEGVYHVDECEQRGCCQAAVVLRLFCGDGQPFLPNIIGNALPLLAHGLDLLEERLVLKFSRGLQSVKRNRPGSLHAVVPAAVIQRIEQTLGLI